jgi:prophage regulatory protein
MLEDLGKPLDPLLREAEVEVITSLSKTTRWRKIKAGEFPAPIKISARRCAWRKSDIASWLATKTAPAA